MTDIRLLDLNVTYHENKVTLREFQVSDVVVRQVLEIPDHVIGKIPHRAADKTRQRRMRVSSELRDQLPHRRDRVFPPGSPPSVFRDRDMRAVRLKDQARTQPESWSSVIDRL